MVRKSNIVFVGVEGRGIKGGDGMGEGRVLQSLQLHVLGLVFWEIRHGAFGWRVTSSLFLLLQSLLCCISLDVLWGERRAQKKRDDSSRVRQKCPQIRVHIRPVHRRTTLVMMDNDSSSLLRSRWQPLHHSLCVLVFPDYRLLPNLSSLWGRSG